MLSRLVRANRFAMMPFARAKGDVPFSWPVPKQLREVVKMSAMQREDGLSIKFMWTEQFKANPRICTNSIFESDFNRIQTNMRRAPFFMVPLQMGNGQINLLVQCQDARHIMFTSIEQYTKDPENAPPYAIATAFDELLGTKGLSLWRIDGISLDLKREDLYFLLKYAQAFYLDPNLFHWVERFNHQPRAFDYNEFVTATRSVVANIRGEADKELFDIDLGSRTDPRSFRADGDKALRMEHKPTTEFKDWF